MLIIDLTDYRYNRLHRGTIIKLPKSYSSYPKYPGGQYLPWEGGWSAELLGLQESEQRIAMSEIIPDSEYIFHEEQLFRWL